MRKGGARDVERALEIDVHDRAEPVWRKVLGQADEISGRAVDDDVEAAERLCGLRRRRLDGSRLADVAGQRERMHAGPLRSRRVGSRCSCLRLVIATLQPADASASAMPRQMPVPPPVTRAARPFRRSGWNGLMGRLSDGFYLLDLARLERAVRKW